MTQDEMEKEIIRLRQAVEGISQWMKLATPQIEEFIEWKREGEAVLEELMGPELEVVFVPDESLTRDKKKDH